MRKNNLYKYKLILFLGIILLGTSCSDYLSETPDNRTTLDSSEKVAELLTNAYPLASYYYIAETMSDNVGDRETPANEDQFNTRLYSWDVPIEEEQDSPTFFWEASYKAIAQANYALQAIDEQDDGSEVWESLRGEALLCRAYAHFMMVNLWGKHYNSETASSDLGIPYVTEPETELIKEYERNTVEEVYNLIENDMLEGMELITNNYDQPKYHFTSTAAYAFATRFYLFRGDANKGESANGDWDKVIDYANLALGANPQEKIRDISYTNSLETYTALAYHTSPDNPANILLVDAPSWYSVNREPMRIYRYGMDEEKVDELFYTPNPYNKSWNYSLYGSSPNFYVFKLDRYFKVTNINAQTGIDYVRNVVFSYDEVLLARAEAYAMIGSFDNSLNDLNTYLPEKTTSYNPSTDILSNDNIVTQNPNASEEYKPYYVLTPQQASYIGVIADMRRMEFYSEGLRWFDIKRFHLEVTHEIFNRDNLTLSADDNRRVLQIPSSAIAQGIEANPR